MAFGLLLPLRIAQGVFSLIILGLSAYVAHWYDADTLTASPSQINFLIFVPLFSFISIAYLEVAPRRFAKVSHPYAHFAFEVVNTLFFFTGFTALAVFLSKLLFCRGSVCAAARADAVFAALTWMLWTATTAICGMAVFKGGFKGTRTDKRAAAAMKEAASSNNV